MIKQNDTFLLPIWKLLLLLNIQVFSENQISHPVVINKEEKQANSVFVTLVNEELPTGEYEVEFNTSTMKHHPSSGIYFYQLKVYPAHRGAGSFIEKKMILIK